MVRQASKNHYFLKGCLFISFTILENDFSHYYRIVPASAKLLMTSIPSLIHPQGPVATLMAMEITVPAKLDASVGASL